MYGWIDRVKAAARITEIEGEIGALEGERTLLRAVLGVAGARPEPARPAATPAPRPAAGPAAGGVVGRKIGLMDAIIEVLQGAAPRALTVAEIKKRMTATYPELASRKPAVISSAIFQARDAKIPRLRRVGSPRGRGALSKWAAA